MLQSFFSLLYVGIVKRIKEKVPEIRWVDQDLGQIDFYEESPSVAWPCVLTDFNTTGYDPLMQQVQTGNVTINVRLAFAPFSQSSSTAPQAVMDKALQFWEIEMKLYQALQNWTPDDNICQPLVRISAATERRNDPIRVRTLVFTTAFEDASADRGFLKTPKPDLEEEYYQTP